MYTITSNFGRTNNPLLQREDVGWAKPSCHKLPEEGYTFGRIEFWDPEGAGDSKFLINSSDFLMEVSW